MRINTNKNKLEQFLAAEERKLSNAHPVNKARPYWNLIRESKQRLSRNNSSHRPSHNKFSNNENWYGNFSGLVNAVPLILVTNNTGRYLGHIWVNGTKAPNRSTGHFQGIQKTVNLNNNIIKSTKSAPLPRVKVAPFLMRAVENHLRRLGYGAMSTHSPLGKMYETLRRNKNWKRTGPMVFKKNL
jgi:hypothetical protein